MGNLSGLKIRSVRLSYYRSVLGRKRTSMIGFCIESETSRIDRD